MSDAPESWAGEEEPDDFREPAPSGPVYLVELEGGPLDGRQVASEIGIEWLTFHDQPSKGMTATYRPTWRQTKGGRPIFEWIETPPEARDDPTG